MRGKAWVEKLVDDFCKWEVPRIDGTFEIKSLGHNAGGVHSLVAIDGHQSGPGDMGRIIPYDFMPDSAIKLLKEECAEWRRREREGLLNGNAKSRIACKIPITIHHAARQFFLWLRSKGHIDVTWQTFELALMRHPEMRDFMCTEKSLPEVYERDLSVSWLPLALPHLPADPLLADLNKVRVKQRDKVAV